MNYNPNMDLTKFEVLSETGNGSLIGGFSVALAANLTRTPLLESESNVLANCSETTNNCQGGNCVKGCGA
jgi:hypothetical protein